MAHPSLYRTEAQVAEVQKTIHSALNERNASLKAADTVPLVKPKRPDYSTMSHFDLRLICDRFEAKADRERELSEKTAREFELETKERNYLDILKTCGRDVREKILGKDFPSAATKHHDHPIMVHQDGLLDIVREELSQIRAEMPKLVRSAQLYLWERENLPTSQEVRAAFDGERAERDQLRG